MAGNPIHPERGNQVNITLDNLRVQCDECGRVFDLLDETDAAEWSSGHDCE